MFLLPFHVIGCSHETNAPELVGGVRLSVERTADALGALHRRGVPAVLLSTCHRTELYWWGDDDLDAWFADTLGSASAGTIQFERADADLAVRHLFAVAAGMRSVRFGEPEILGQLRRAWTLARHAGTAFGPLDGVFRHAIDAARHIRAEMGMPSDASLGDRVHDRITGYAAVRGASDLRVLVVGSGDAARGVLESLRVRPVRGAHVQVTSRTDMRAAAIAQNYGVGALAWDDRDFAIERADVVVFAVHVTTPLVDGHVAATLPVRSTPSLWIDLGMPGAVCGDFAAPAVRLVTLADLEQDESAGAQHDSGAWRAQHEARRRRAAIALQQELARYARATHRLSLGARLGALEEQAVAVASQHSEAPVDEVVRKVTRLVLRELTRS